MMLRRVEKSKNGTMTKCSCGGRTHGGNDLEVEKR